MSKTYTFHKIADDIQAINFSRDHLAEIEVNGKRICLAHAGEKLFACAAKCPHASGILSRGSIDGNGNIVCPVHRYKFSLSTGRNTSGEGFYLKTFPVEEREDGIFVGT